MGVLCVILISGTIIFFSVKRKIRNISRQAFGTDSFVEGYMNKKKELSETPRSLHSMTKNILPAIKRDFPEFDYAQFRQKAENMLRAYFNSIEAKNIGELESVGATDIILEKATGIINDLASMERTQRYDEISIYRTEISDYQHGDGSYVIKLESAVGLYDYVTDKNDKVVGGDKNLKRQTVYAHELVYIQDPDKLKNCGYYSAISLSCPNCGAPIKNIGRSKFCEFCGSGVKEINVRSWSFNDIREISNQNKKYY